MKKVYLLLVSVLITSFGFSQNRFEKLEGKWKLKEGKFEYTDSGKYAFFIDTAIYMTAELVPGHGIIWNYDLQGGNYGKIFWTYNQSESTVYWLSDNAIKQMAHGKSIQMAGDSIVFQNYFDGLPGYRRYIFKLVSVNELYVRAFYYLNDMPTGDFYGGTFYRVSRK